MAIVRTDVPTTSARCEEWILQIVEQYPFCRTELLTLSTFRRPVRALVIGEGERKVLYTAAHHANEWITATLLLKFGETLAEAIATRGRIYGVPAQTVARAATVYLVPMVDPDGVDLVTGAIGPEDLQYQQAQRLSRNYPQIPFPEGWKADLQGVDLNLQYPAGWLRAREIKFAQGFDRPGPRDYVGRSPLSQPEPRALAEYTADLDPALVLAYHTQGKEIYWQFDDIQVPGARALGEEFARLSGYALADVPYASGFAGYKDWFLQAFRRPGYTIEAGSGQNPLPLDQFDEIWRDNLGILVTAATGIPEE